MKICYLDAFSGISGDMTVGALIDAGAPCETVFDALHSFDTGARFSAEKTIRGGIAATKFRVDIGNSGNAHRHLSHILELIEHSSISLRAKSSACAVFQRLGEAEAQVHGVPLERVHFHEVGAADSIADIVGACVALDLLGIDELYVSPMNTGSGTVKTEHGILPVPAPATAVLLQGKPIYARGPEVELTTPTGAALAVTLASRFGSLPAMSILSLGYGAGDRDFKEHPNVLRAIVGESAQASEATLVSVIEANIDDSSPQVLGYAMERLMDAGALDVSLSPLQMKKNRPGALLRVIARPEDQERLAQIVLAETSTLGLRIHSAERRVIERHIVEVDTPFGTVRIKVAAGGSFAPEYDDCREIAARTGTPLPQVIAAANEAYLSQRSVAAPAKPSRE
jgi:pyridinium-3,5-bisthiocarboxylic acid mononucleotide nickel chelatase